MLLFENYSGSQNVVPGLIASVSGNLFRKANSQGPTEPTE